MGIRGRILTAHKLAALFRDGLIAAIVATALCVPGCARFCALGGSPSAEAPVAQKSASPSMNHHPSLFPEEGGEEPEAPPQTVNMFGEVNGAAPHSTAISGEAAFQQHTFADEGYDSDVTVDPTGQVAFVFQHAKQRTCEPLHAARGWNSRHAGERWNVAMMRIPFSVPMGSRSPSVQRAAATGKFT